MKKTLIITITALLIITAALAAVLLIALNKGGSVPKPDVSDDLGWEDLPEVLPYETDIADADSLLSEGKVLEALSLLEESASKYPDKTEIVQHLDYIRSHTVITRMKYSDSDGYGYEYTYDKNGNILTYTDTMGYSASYTYDESGNNTYFTNSYGYSYNDTYDGNERVKRETSDGAVFTYTYKDGNLFSQDYSYGGFTTHTEYDSFGNITAYNDGEGTAYSAIYDQSGNVLSYERNDGYWFRHTYDASGNETYYENSEGTTRNYTYNDMGLLLEYTSNKGDRETYTYDEKGNLLRWESKNGDWKNYGYDASGNCTSYEDNAGNRTIDEYDESGNNIYHEESNGYSFTRSYDEAGNCIYEEVQSDLEWYCAVYDADGRTLALDGSFGKYDYEYDEMKNPTHAGNDFRSEDREYDYLYIP